MKSFGGKCDLNQVMAYFVEAILSIDLPLGTSDDQWQEMTAKPMAF